MTFRPELEAMLGELRGLGARDLRFTLSALHAQEQAEILELIDARPAIALTFETLAGISPWLAKRLEAARGSDRSVDGRDVMTKATGDALNAAVATLGTASNHDASKGQAARSASWLDRFMRRPIKGAVV